VVKRVFIPNILPSITSHHGGDTHVDRETCGPRAASPGGNLEEPPISGVTRRTFLLSSLALASECAFAFSQRPPLDELYRHTGNGDQPPLIVIPGAFGSRLLDTRTGEEIWPKSSRKLLFSSYKGLEVEIDEATLDPVKGDVQPYRVFRKGLGRDFYGQILNTLEGPGGYQRRLPGEPVAPKQRNYYVYLYDWRLDNVAAVAGLHELIERIRVDYGNPGLQVDILAHSNGGLLARYYARYGATDLLDTADATPTYAGAPAIRRLLLVGTPNLGSMQPVLSHVRGEEIGFRKIPAEVVATTSGAPQMMPHPAIPWLVDSRGDAIDRDVFDLETWRDFRWSIFDPHVRERTIHRKGGGAAGRRYLEILEAYLGKHLARGRNFMLLISSESTGQDVKPFIFGGDCDATVARLVVEEVRGKMLARERAESIEYPMAGIDYHALIHDPGDSVVTRSSLLGRCETGLLPGFSALPSMPASHSVFLCEQHQFLTGNRTFQNNLLHTLLNLDPAWI
jgi:pimeloyl-ACP methyl ester carboxylesterase